MPALFVGSSYHKHHDENGKTNCHNQGEVVVEFSEFHVNLSEGHRLQYWPVSK